MVSARKRNYKLGLSRPELPWVEIGAAVLVVSMLVNVCTITTLYLNDVLGFEGTAVVVDVDDFKSISIWDNRIVDADADEQMGSGLRRLHPHGLASVSNMSIERLGRRTSSSGSSSGSAGGHSGPHKQDALLYLFNALVIGAAVMQLSAKYPFLQQTVVLFVLGFLYSLLVKAFKLSDKMGEFGDSYNMWMEIDPHLLLFTMLPALLAGDAMTIDTSVAKKVGMQCLWLAGPGVLVGGFGCAFFLWGYLGWDFYLCLCAGAILCATDPVAVVALLKELGASPVLTVQIQGESLLNDGTAIVLYLISYEILRGQHFEWADVAEFLVKKALMAWALGLFIGYFFFSWIRAAADKLDHSSGMIQITLTLCCAYWSFTFVEGVLTLSGVLATVAASLVLAHHMWPYIVSEESMTHVWHTFESLGNIIIFFLAGSITGKTVVDIDAIDYVHLLVIYIFLTLLRGCLIFGSRPILRLLNADRQAVTWQDAVVMTWGGLRGAVGLALAISVNIDRAPDICDPTKKGIDAKHAERLLFYVSGIAFLTMVVNATTAPYLVGKLGITALPQARQALLKMFHQQLVNWSVSGENPPEVTEALKEMLHEAEEEIDHQQVSATGPASRRNTKTDDNVRRKDNGEGKSNLNVLNDLEANENKLLALFDQMFPGQEFQAAVNNILGEDLDLQDGEESKNLLGNVNDMKDLVREQWVDDGMAKVVNQCFLTLVFNNYWKAIEEGDLRPGSPESEVLFTSVRVALSPYRPDLVDYDYVYKMMIDNAEFKDELDGNENDPFADESMQAAPNNTPLAHFLSSAQFNIGIAVVILLNSIQVICEEIWRDNCEEKCGSTCAKKDIDDHPIWLVLDVIFTTLFTVEFLLKCMWLKCNYFKDNWNRFDFFLVAVGLFGLIASVSASGGGDVAGKTRIIRIARVLRTLRFLRIFRLFHAKLSADRYVSLDLARHMKKIVTLNCFITAHLTAENQLVRYFGGNGKLDEVNETEIARCILQSQVCVYDALYQAGNTKSQLGDDVSQELETLRKRKRITEGLSRFVTDAHSSGALSSTETHAILHPLNHQIAMCMKMLNDRADGVLDKSPHEHALHAGFGTSKTKNCSGDSSPKLLAKSQSKEMKDGKPVQDVSGHDREAAPSTITVQTEDSFLQPAQPELEVAQVTSSTYPLL